MNYLYSLYDALVSINVPSDKARAVVDAMEGDMTAALATKQDLVELRMHTDAQYSLLRQEIELLRVTMSGEQKAQQVSIAGDLEALRASMAGGQQILRNELESMQTLTARDLEALRTSMTIRLGSMLMLGLGLLFAALRLT